MRSPDHPHLLGADAFEDEGERRWILVRREKAVEIEDTGVTSTGWVDHLFDEDGIAAQIAQLQPAITDGIESGVAGDFSLEAIQSGLDRG